MQENFSIFLRIYYQPKKAVSDALDKGSFAFSLVIVAVVMALWAIGLASLPVVFVAHPLIALIFPKLLAIIGLFGVAVPASVAVLAVWDGLGSISVVLRREYLSLLISGLMAWAAAYLPGAFLSFLVPQLALLLTPAAHLIFFGLFVLCLVTALGASPAHAIASAAIGWLAAIASMFLLPAVQGYLYFLLSPWILYILYRNFSPDFRSLGDTMSSRRSFRKEIEASMLNPRDADAHYQLGLLYQQRRQHEEAATSFRRAIEIRDDEAEPHLQLGRVLLAAGQLEEALGHLRLAVKLDPNVSRSEGWRDLGIALMKLGQFTDAEASLARYTNQRSYDPEGLFHYAVALKALGKTDEARQFFQRTLEAVQTAPSYRRSQLRSWAAQAKSQLKSL